MFNKLKLVLFNPLNREQKKLLKQLNTKTFGIFISTYWEYKKEIKNNENDSLKIATKKLLRNVVLGKRIRVNGNIETYQYGNLTIKYSPFVNQVIDIHNSIGRYYFDYSKKQKQRKEWLNTYLEIER